MNMLLKNYPEGSDVTLLNNFYCYPKKNEDTGKWDKGSMTLIYRDNITGEKYNECIEDPDYEYYISNEPINYPALFIPINETHMIKAPFTSLEKSIAQETGNEAFYRENISNGNRQANKLLHTVNDVFNSDMHIEDHYRFRFDKEYTNEVYSYSKAFFDIEADTINMKGDFPEPGECPINAITIICQEEKKFYTFLLRNERNPQIAEFEKNINKALFDEIRDLIRTVVGGRKKEIKYELDKYDYQFLFYDEEDEIKLISDLFGLINTYRPDFVLAWNMAFDIPYIIERIKKLGYRPEDIICNPEFNHKIAEYYIDTFHQSDFQARGDYANISSYSVFMCQMIQFASRRKGQSAFSQFGLNYIGNAIAGVKKLDYSHITTNIAELPWKDYKTFVIYNIVDTIVQLVVESVTGDIDYVAGKALMNNTRYAKAHRQTVYLANRGCKEFYKDGYIICNNHNKYKDKPNGKFPGAIVANPNKLLDIIKTKLFVGRYNYNKQIEQDKQQISYGQYLSRNLKYPQDQFEYNHDEHSEEYWKPKKEQSMILDGIPVTVFDEDGHIICKDNGYGIGRTRYHDNDITTDSSRILRDGSVRIPILHNLVDYDYKSLYPSIMIEFNIAPNTQIGKILIDYQIWKDENKYRLHGFDRGGKFLDDFQTQNWIHICNRWFGLASYKDLYIDVISYFQNNYSAHNPFFFTRDGLMNGISFYDEKVDYAANIWFEEDKEKLMNPVHFYRDYTEIKKSINQYYNDKNLL